MKVAAIQNGPMSEDRERNVQRNLELVDRAAAAGARLIVLGELSTTPYWCCVHDRALFDWAETIPGPTTDLFAERAARYQCYIMVPLFERGEVAGEFYNSAALLGPDGRLVQGTLPDGQRVRGYRKNHIPTVMLGDQGLVDDERFYFKPGPGFPVFDTDFGRLGMMICIDRSFPEAWRTMACQGAQIIIMASSIPSWNIERVGHRSELFTAELRIRALENQVFVIGCNRSGQEDFAGTGIGFFGMSCIIDPYGTVVAQAAPGEGETIVTAEIELDLVARARTHLPFYMMRRPEVYGPIVASTARL